MVANQIAKKENQLKKVKEQDFLHGNIYGDNRLLRYRSKAYEMYKSRKNPIAGGAVDLIDTGDFIDAMYLLKPRGNKYLFGNRDAKKKMLVEKYGNDIFGLSEDLFEKFLVDFIAQPFIKEIKQKLGQ